MESDDMKRPIAEYVHMSKYIPNNPVKIAFISRFSTVNIPSITGINKTTISNNEKIHIEKYFPNTTCQVLTGEESNNFILPLLNSRLINPIVNKGKKQYNVSKIAA